MLCYHIYVHTVVYKLKVIFDNQQLNLSDTITKSLQVVSDMTNYTTVVLGSTSHDNLLKQIEVVPINDEYIKSITLKIGKLNNEGKRKIDEYINDLLKIYQK